MDQTRTGALIRTLRQQKHLTQRQLADTIGVSDKAVSKWERGCGAPDISLLPRLSQALGTSAEALLRGDLEENDLSNGNMKRVRVFFEWFAAAMRSPFAGYERAVSSFVGLPPDNPPAERTEIRLDRKSVV